MLGSVSYTHLDVYKRQVISSKKVNANESVRKVTKLVCNYNLYSTIKYLQRCFFIINFVTYHTIC